MKVDLSLALIVKRQDSLSLRGFFILARSLVSVLTVGPCVIVSIFRSLISCLVFVDGIIPASMSSVAISSIHLLEEREK